TGSSNPAPTAEPRSDESSTPAAYTSASELTSTTTTSSAQRWRPFSSYRNYQRGSAHRYSYGSSRYARPWYYDQGPRYRSGYSSPYATPYRSYRAYPPYARRRSSPRDATPWGQPRARVITALDTEN